MNLLDHLKSEMRRPPDSDVTVTCHKSRAASHADRASTTVIRPACRAAAKAARPVLARGAHKGIKFSDDGRAHILKGVGVLANAVSVTLGPKGTKSHSRRLDF